MNSSRRLFVVDAAAGAVTLMLGACGGSDDSPAPAPAPAPAAAPPPPPPPAGVLACGATAISANHGHSLALAPGDVDSTVAKVYGIAGQADHNHLVTLTPAQFAQLKAQTPVTVVSTTGGDGHTHAVTVACM